MGGNVEAALQQGGKGEVSWFYSEPRSWKSKGTPAMPPPKKEVLIKGLLSIMFPGGGWHCQGYP